MHPSVLRSPDVPVTIRAPLPISWRAELPPVLLPILSSLLVPEQTPLPAPAAHVGGPCKPSKPRLGRDERPVKLLAGDERKLSPPRLERVAGALEPGLRPIS